ncbi:MAG: lipid A export permease/ATP-binding protein MsbA [Arenicellaceae bacterium]|nr:lipid A export permease/ATP-binding protein MsbA [Arenicellaceae bacterium]
MNTSNSPVGVASNPKVNPVDQSSLTRMIGYVSRHKLIFFVAALFLVIGAAVQTLSAWIIEPLVNDGLVDPKPEVIRWLPIALGVLLFVQAVSNFVGSYAMAVVGRGVIANLRSDLFARMMVLPSAFYEQNSSSRLISKLVYDVEQTAVATTDTLTSLIKDLLATLGLLGLMFYLDWRLTLIFIAFVPIIVVAMRLASKRFRVTTEKIQDSVSGITRLTREAADGQRLVKTYSAAEQVIKAFDSANQTNYRRSMKRSLYSSAVVPVTTLITGVPFAIIMYVYLNYLMVGQEEGLAGTFMSFVGALVMVLSPIKRLGKVNEKIQIGLTSAKSAFEIIDMEAEQDTGTLAIGRAAGALEFNQVGFAYPWNREVVLSGINISIQPGKRIAIVGPSGSGKSTLTALLLRLYMPLEGEITLDGVDIKSLSLSELRAQFAIVSQDAILFDDTVLNNIVFGSGVDIDDSRLKNVLAAAYVNEFINDLPVGIETKVGENGVRLSGGQRQRIAIARALYRDAPILILDEATSALDARSERYVQNATEVLMQNRTSLVIAHRLSTVVSADEIIVLADGKISERGSHMELLAKDGLYAELYYAQASRVAKVNPDY